ncbi:FkbM family methyltransferase [Steroidobacter sp. S1-65]|uniref:FkbM family methyltransferase n=1 Tax=Steroidobacter gossypii TaxID=2805490 RepID=A0ABS1WZ21_9GAMM|nr:FkbM family methyltransferase [Steroidobacter gossypii]MBM0106167.1 FkbM family methyltransferase [Steroidobacter gossypii]
MRSITRILGAVTKPQHYVSLANSHIYGDWREFFVKRYVLGRGDYPYSCRIRTPTGPVALTLYQHEDCFTVQEIFGLECYRADDARVVVDFGANIGVSAAYFLTRRADARVYCFEPLATNIERFRRNLAAFDGRWTLTEAAVAADAGTISFHVEPTGRYSGVECQDGELRQFPCVSAEAVLSDVIDRHGTIDLLKIDIEGAEALFMRALSPRVLANIRRIYIEGQQTFALQGFQLSLTVSGVHCYSAASSR